MKNDYDQDDHKILLYFINLIQKREQEVASYIGVPMSKINYAEVLQLSKRLVTYYELLELKEIKNIEKCKKQ